MADIATIQTSLDDEARRRLAACYCFLLGLNGRGEKLTDRGEVGGHTSPVEPSIKRPRRKECDVTGDGVR